MEEFNQKYDYFVSVLRNINDDKDLVYVATLDALHKWIANEMSIRMINQFLEKEIDLNKNKLLGITLALVELQRIKFIPDYLLATLIGLVERFIFEDDEYINYEWINNIFILCRRSFSGTKFLWLVSLINNINRELPEKYAAAIINVIDHWAIRNSKTKEVISYYRSAATRTKDLIVSGDDNNHNQTNANRLMLLKILFKLCSVNEKIWGKLIINTLPIQNYLFNFLINPSRFYGFVGVTTVLAALLGHFLMKESHGSILFSAVYVIVSLSLRLIFLRKIGNSYKTLQPNA